MNFTMTHYMGNWTAYFTYTGKPDVSVAANTTWDSTLSFIVNWSPIPQIKSKIEMDEEDDWSASTQW